MTIQILINLCAILGAGVYTLICWDDEDSRWDDRLFTAIFGAFLGAGAGIVVSVIMVMLSILVIIIGRWI